MTMRWFRSSRRFGRAGRGTGRSAAAIVLSAAAMVSGAAGAALAGSDYGLPAAELSTHRFVSEVNDATAVFVNPAGIGVLTGNHAFLSVAGYSDDLDGLSLGVQGGVLALGYRHRELSSASPGGIEPARPGLPALPVGGKANFDLYTLAAGVGPTWLRAGAGFTLATSDLPGDDASSWSVGLRSRPHPAVSVGATAANIDRPAFLDGELRTVYTYGLTVHPIPGRPEWLAVTAEGANRDGDGRIDLAYGARMLSRRGLELAVLVRDDNGEDPYVGFSATVYLGQFGAEAGFRAVNRRGDDLRWHAAGHLYDGDWRRARAPRERMGS